MPTMNSLHRRPLYCLVLVLLLLCSCGIGIGIAGGAAISEMKAVSILKYL